jgi:hypothetical protein
MIYNQLLSWNTPCSMAHLAKQYTYVVLGKSTNVIGECVVQGAAPAYISSVFSAARA